MPRAQRMKSEDASRRRSRGTASGKQDTSSFTSRVIEMLTADHQRVKKLFQQGERAEDDAERLQGIVDEACEALTAHAEIEEEFFYPALTGTEARELVAEAEVEHNSAKQLIADLQGMDVDDERYRATFKVLGEYVKHHIKEEESEIFPLARASKADFEPLFEALSARNADDETDGDDEASAASRDDDEASGDEDEPAGSEDEITGDEGDGHAGRTSGGDGGTRARRNGRTSRTRR